MIGCNLPLLFVQDRRALIARDFFIIMHTNDKLVPHLCGLKSSVDPDASSHHLTKSVGVTPVHEIEATCCFRRAMLLDSTISPNDDGFSCLLRRVILPVVTLALCHQMRVTF